MFDFRKFTRLLLMLILSLRGLRQNKNPESILVPTTILYEFTRDECKRSNALNVCHMLWSIFVPARASLFTDHKISGPPQRGSLVPFSIWFIRTSSVPFQNVGGKTLQITRSFSVGVSSPLITAKGQHPETDMATPATEVSEEALLLYKKGTCTVRTLSSIPTCSHRSVIPHVSHHNPLLTVAAHPGWEKRCKSWRALREGRPLASKAKEKTQILVFEPTRKWETKRE